MNSFYVELFSNAIYPYNTIANFRNKIQLLHPLEGNWEVGLVELSYKKSWKNLRNYCILSIEEMFAKPLPYIALANVYGYFPFKNEERKGIVRSGYYDSVKILCEEIEKEMLPFKEEHQSLPQFFIDDVSNHVLIKPGVKKDGHPNLPTMNRELSQLLGFENYTTQHPNYNENRLVVSDRPADITSGINTLFVYCNLIIPQYVGDTRAKLLKTVTIPNSSKHGDTISQTFNNPHYVPLLITDFEDIEIDIKDDTNSRILFMSGKTRVKLHFKKCQTLT